MVSEDNCVVPLFIIIAEVEVLARRSLHFLIESHITYSVDELARLCPQEFRLLVVGELVLVVLEAVLDGHWKLHCFYLCTAIRIADHWFFLVL